MDVKVDNKIYRGTECLVMVKLTEQDKWNIAHMDEDATIYSMFPEEKYAVGAVLVELELFKEEV